MLPCVILFEILIHNLRSNYDFLLTLLYLSCYLCECEVPVRICCLLCVHCAKEPPNDTQCTVFCKCTMYIHIYILTVPAMSHSLARIVLSRCFSALYRTMCTILILLKLLKLPYTTYDE